MAGISVWDSFQAKKKLRNAESSLVSDRIGTSAKSALKLCWSDFEGQFEKILDNLREQRMFVEDEAKAAAMEDSQVRFKRLEYKAEGVYTSYMTDLAAQYGRNCGFNL